MAPGIIVRPATAGDVLRLVELDRLAFEPSGIQPFSRGYFDAWLETNPEGLLVAESRGAVVGYHYGQYVDFGFDRIDSFTTFDVAADGGFTRATHRPEGNGFHGVSMCSLRPGAGKMLFRHAFIKAAAAGKEFYFGFTRMAGFAAFAASLAPAEGVGDKLDNLALWYAWENVKLTNGLAWPSAGRQPSLALPPLAASDPVLGRQLRLHGYGLARILPGCMHDPESLGYAALLVRRLNS